MFPINPTIWNMLESWGEDAEHWDSSNAEIVITIVIVSSVYSLQDVGEIQLTPMVVIIIASIIMTNDSETLLLSAA
jgi:hypothetical protein